MAAEQGKFFPISELSAYQGRWTLKAKVTTKSLLRTFARRGGGGGEGKVFHVEITDGPQGEIRASFFNEAADAFYEKLQVGKVYTFARGTVKVANRQYNSTNHRYELTFERNADIVQTTGDIEVGEVQFNFTDLRAVQSKQCPCRVDLCGVVSQFRPLSTVNAKDGRELIKRDIVIVDDTATSLDVTLWGEKGKCPDSNFEGNPIVALKNIFVKEWNGGRSGGSLESTTIVFKPDSADAKRIEDWWLRGGSTQHVHSLRGAGGAGGGAVRNGQSCTVGEMRRKAELVGEQPEIYNVTARLAVVQTRKQGEPQPLHYVACAELKEGSTLTCNRRVDSSGVCPSCNRAGKTAIRLNLRCKYADFDNSCWLTTFHEGAQTVLNMSADKVAEMDSGADGESGSGRDRLETTLKDTYFYAPYELAVRAKLDSFNGEPRSNTVCIGVAPVNLRQHGRKLLTDIQQLLTVAA